MIMGGKLVRLKKNGSRDLGYQGYLNKQKQRAFSTQARRARVSQGEGRAATARWSRRNLGMERRERREKRKKGKKK